MMAGEKAMPSASGGQRHVPSACQNMSRPAGQQRVEQQEAGDGRDGECGPSWPMNGSTGSATPNSRMNNSAQRNSGTDSSTMVPGSRDRLSCACRARGTAAARPRCRACWRSASRSSASSIVAGRVEPIKSGDVAAEMDRAAEIAVQRLRQPDQRIARQRLVEAHLAALRLDVVDAWRWVASTSPPDRPAGDAGRENSSTETISRMTTETSARPSSRRIEVMASEAPLDEAIAISADRDCFAGSRSSQ